MPRNTVDTGASHDAAGVTAKGAEPEVAREPDAERPDDTTLTVRADAAGRTDDRPDTSEVASVRADADAEPDAKPDTDAKPDAKASGRGRRGRA